MKNINNRIIDFLTLRIMSQIPAEENPNTRVKSAWLLAKKEFETLTEEDKYKIIDELNGFEYLKKMRDLDEKMES